MINISSKYKLVLYDWHSTLFYNNNANYRLIDWYNQFNNEKYERDHYTQARDQMIHDILRKVSRHAKQGIIYQ